MTIARLITNLLLSHPKILCPCHATPTIFQLMELFVIMSSRFWLTQALTSLLLKQMSGDKFHPQLNILRLKRRLVTLNNNVVAPFLIWLIFPTRLRQSVLLAFLYAAKIRNTESSMFMLCLSQFVPIHYCAHTFCVAIFTFFPNTMVDTSSKPEYLFTAQLTFFRICYLTFPLQILTLSQTFSSNILNNYSCLTHILYLLVWSFLFLSFCP